jgi:hypothetical protein
VHELRWHSTLDQIIQLRRDLRSRYGVKLREELHASDLIHHPGALARVPKSLRLRLLRDVLEFEATLPDVSLVNVVVNKAGKTPPYDVFEHAWRALLQRIENTISYRNFPGPQNPQDNFVLVVDRTDEKKLRLLSRRLRKYNPIPSKFMGGATQFKPILALVEDASHRDSAHSYFIQLCDINAYFTHQQHAPCKYVRRQGARHYFTRLKPILCLKASSTDPFGVVHL